MKSLKKTYIYLAVLGTLALFLASGLVSAAPGVEKLPPINAGNMSQPIRQLNVGNTGLNIGFDVSGVNQISLFPSSESIFGVFGNFFSGGQTWIGNGNTQNPSDPATNIPWTTVAFPDGATLPVHTLNIEGTLMADSLSHSPVPDQVPLCVGPEGILFLCAEGEPQATWQVGTWGQCINGSQVRDVQCVRGGTVVDNSECTPPAPASSQSCNNGQCQSFPSGYASQPANAGNGCLVGTYQDTSDSASTWNWQCLGSNGGTTASCSAQVGALGQFMCQSNGNWGNIGTCTAGNQNPTYDSSSSYASGNIVCSSSTPNNNTCSAGGACEGTYTTTGTSTKVDWDGQPLNWDEDVLYNDAKQPVYRCSIANVPQNVDIYHTTSAPYSDTNPTGLPGANYYCQYIGGGAQLNNNGTYSCTQQGYLGDWIISGGGPNNTSLASQSQSVKNQLCGFNYTVAYRFWSPADSGNWAQYITAAGTGFQPGYVVTKNGYQGALMQSLGGGNTVQCSTLTSYGQAYCESYPNNNTTCTWNPNG